MPSGDIAEDRFKDLAVPGSSDVALIDELTSAWSRFSGVLTHFACRTLGTDYNNKLITSQSDCLLKAKLYLN
jgi:hypothetical protein